jgi:hypothetical protein
MVKALVVTQIIDEPPVDIEGPEAPNRRRTHGDMQAGRREWVSAQGRSGGGGARTVPAAIRRGSKDQG